MFNIVNACQNKSLWFNHIEGTQNPSDLVTRISSPKTLKKSNYFNHTVLSEVMNNEAWKFVVPNPIGKNAGEIINVAATNVRMCEPVIDVDDVTSFKKIANVMAVVFCFVNKLKEAMFNKNKVKYSRFENSRNAENIKSAHNYLILAAQRKYYGNVFSFFEDGTVSDIPIISQLNLFLDSDGLIRVNCKFKRFRGDFSQRCSLLLNRKDNITKAIIMDIHIKMLHGGVYKILNILRKTFWVPKAYSTVKTITNDCFTCKRLYGRSIKINQNAYQDLRVNPETIPFRNLSLDYIGPFNINGVSGGKVKTYILTLASYWSRAVNLIVCDSLDTSSFLKAIQLHIFEYGIPSKIISDNGTQIVQGIALLKKVLSNIEVRNFLKQHKIENLNFNPYPANTSKLGGIIESLVKQVKNMIYSSFKLKNFYGLNFYFLVQEVKIIINKRPIAYKNNLSMLEFDSEFPMCLTPEFIVKAYEMPSISLLPKEIDLDDVDFSLDEDDEKVWNKVFKSFKRTQKIRSKIYNI